MVICNLAMVETRVRFPYPAPDLEVWPCRLLARINRSQRLEGGSKPLRATKFERKKRMKPVHMCDELGCTREWKQVVVQYGHAYNAPKSTTGMNLKLCDPCAEKRGMQSVPAQA